MGFGGKRCCIAIYWMNRLRSILREHRDPGRDEVFYVRGLKRDCLKNTMMMPFEVISAVTIQ